MYYTLYIIFFIILTYIILKISIVHFVSLLQNICAAHNVHNINQKNKILQNLHFIIIYIIYIKQQNKFMIK